jgi:hypothetical protein
MHLLLLNEVDRCHHQIHLGLYNTGISRKLVHLLLDGCQLGGQLRDAIHQTLLHLVHVRYQETRLRIGLIGPRGALSSKLI